MFLDVSESAGMTLKATGAYKVGKAVAQGSGWKPWLHLQNLLKAFKATTCGPALVTLI